MIPAGTYVSMRGSHSTKAPSRNFLTRTANPVSTAAYSTMPSTPRRNMAQCGRAYPSSRRKVLSPRAPAGGGGALFRGWLTDCRNVDLREALFGGDVHRGHHRLVRRARVGTD